MTAIFNHYKPLRNYLRQIELSEALSVIRAYVQHLQFNEQLPRDIEVAPYFLQAKDWLRKKVFPWELETIVREIIINSPRSDSILLPKSLKKWSCFSGAIDKLKDLENNISKLYPKRNILLEIYRIAHRQFPWQSQPNGIWLTRYYKILSHPKLDSIVQRVIGVNAKELYVLGLLLTGVYLKKFALFYPPDIQVLGINKKKLDGFLNHFSSDLESLKKDLIESQEFNENYVYTFNPLKSYPLIKMQLHNKDALISPIPTLLFWRFTEGVYYELLNEKDFSNPFGESIQGYAGEVIKKAIPKNGFVIHSEKEYHIKKKRKDTIDWIVGDQEAALFIETKAKKLRFEAKIEITTTKAITEELNKMTEFVIQVYKTIQDYRNNFYPHYKFDQKRKIFPVILTLEDWYLFGDRLENELNKKVLAKFDNYQLNKDWLKEMPYMICSMDDFERFIQIIASVGINKFMAKKLFDSEKRGWTLRSFMFSDFPEEMAKSKDLFEDIYNEIYPGIR